MSTFDEIMLKAKDVAAAAAHKTGEVVEVSKLNLQALRLNNTILKAYEKLGSAYYNSVKFGPAQEDPIRECVEEIDRLLEEQERLNTEIAQVKKHAASVFCTACGFENPASASFCSRCGQPIGVSTVGVQVTAVQEETPTQEN